MLRFYFYLVFCLLFLDINVLAQSCVWTLDKCVSNMVCARGTCRCPPEKPKWDTTAFKCVSQFPTCTSNSDTCKADTVCNRGVCQCPPEKPGWDDRIYRCAAKSFTVVELATNSTANWGDWGRKEMCDDGSFVVGFRVKYDFTPLNGDKTAINGVELVCSKLVAPVPKRIKSYIGPFGSWVNEIFCPNNERGVGVQYRIHPLIPGIGDDTATNAFRVVCEGGSVISTVEGDLGDWSSTRCPDQFLICGIQTQVQWDQGYSYDDTGLNNFKVLCCSKA